MADIIQAQIIDEEIVMPSADPVAHNMPGGGAVESVNGKTGAVVLTADDVGAVAAETFNTAMQGKQDKLTAGAGAEIKDGVLSATTLGITGAAVGQIARITAVDSDGKPTAWEPVDLPSGGGENALRLIVDTTTTEDVAQIEFTEDIDGNPLKLKKFIFSLEVPAATGVANATIGASDYRWYGGADTPKYSYYGGKTVQLSTSKTTWWGEICMNIEADGKYAIFYKRATNIPYSNNTENSDGGTYHRLDVRYAPYSSGGGIYYWHETIDRIFYNSGSTTVMIPTGTKIRIWGVDA